MKIDTHVTVWTRFCLENLAGPQLAKNFPHFMEPRRFHYCIPSSPSPVHIPSNSNPVQVIPYHFSKIRFNITLPCTPAFYKWVLSLRFVHQKPKCSSLVPHACLMPRPSHSSRLHHPINLLKPTGHVMHQQFNIQQLYALPTLCLCVLYLSENKQRLVPLTA
jgi:hypothetical protein